VSDGGAHATREPDEVLTAREYARRAEEWSHQAHAANHGALAAEESARRYAESAFVMCIAACLAAYVAYRAAQAIGVYMKERES
jgi:hypothetical protein